MKLVKQKDDLGCGVACVASLLGINYNTTLLLFKKGKEYAKNRGFYCKEIVEVLEMNGFTYKYKYLKPNLKKHIYKPKTIIFVRRSKKYPYGHYLLRTNKGWMDPWINFPKSPIKAGYRERLLGEPIYGIFKI